MSFHMFGYISLPIFGPTPEPILRGKSQNPFLTWSTPVDGGRGEEVDTLELLGCRNCIPSSWVSSSPKLSWSCFPAAARDSTPESTVDVINSFWDAVIFKSSLRQAEDAEEVGMSGETTRWRCWGSSNNLDGEVASESANCWRRAAETPEPPPRGQLPPTLRWPTRKHEKYPNLHYTFFSEKEDSGEICP